MFLEYSRRLWRKPSNNALLSIKKSNLIAPLFALCLLLGCQLCLEGVNDSRHPLDGTYILEPPHQIWKMVPLDSRDSLSIAAESTPYRDVGNREGIPYKERAEGQVVIEFLERYGGGLEVLSAS